MADRELRLTESQIDAIEHTINSGYRVEVIPVRDGVKIVRQRRDEIKVSGITKIGF